MNNVNKNNSKNDNNNKDIDNDGKDNSIENMEPLYLDAMDCRVAGVVIANNFEQFNSMPEHLRKKLIYGFIFNNCDQAYPNHYIVEYGYIGYGIESVYYCVMLEQKITESVICPALKEGRIVVIGDVDEKKYTLANAIRDRGFCRTQYDYWNLYYKNDDDIARCEHKVYSYNGYDNNIVTTLRDAWKNGKLFI